MTSRTSLRRALLGALAVLAVHGAAPAAAAGDVITGHAYRDLDGSGSQQVGEPTLSDQRLYLYDSGGAYLRNSVTDSSGAYGFAGLPSGDYRVQYASPDWWALRDDWVPTTTGSLQPRLSVHLSGSSVADFGWRPIVRSTEVGAPISSYSGLNGLKVESYDDVVEAREIYDALMQGLVGEEAPTVLVRFDWGTGSTTTTSVGGTPGSYSGYRAISYVSYVSWLDGGDQTLSHEYGHAWSLYHAYTNQQDPTLAAYLAARGLAGDPRVNSSYEWSAREMIAEDYRQLFGSPNARSAPQTNREIPPPAQVAGLESFLRDVFTLDAGASQPPPAPLEVSSLAMSPTAVKASGTASFTISAPASVTVSVLNAKGSLVHTLLSDAARPAGTVTAGWDRTDSLGRRAKRGTYTLRIQAHDDGDQTSTVAITFSVT
jgi:hypothetical protein